MQGHQDTSDPRRTTVLIVDDAAETAELLAPAFTASGYAVQLATSGREALALIAANAPEVVVLDVGLPDIDGFEVCRLTRLTSRSLVVMLTARDAEDDRVRGLTIGADDYVTKPFSPREVTLRTERLLERTAPRDVQLTLEHERASIDRELGELRMIKRRLLDNVSHEMRTPLTAIVGFAGTLRLRSGQLDGSTIDEIVEHLEHEAVRLDQLMRDVIELESLEHGATRPTPDVVDVGRLALTVLEELDAGTRMDLHVQPTTIVADVAKVARAVRHLVVNSLRHAPAASRRRLCVRPVHAGALIEVEDDGPGVPDEDKHRVFAPFEQRSAAATDHAPGIGVGLALVAQIARLHGGRAWVEDVAGGGARFSLMLADLRLPAASGASDDGRLTLG